MMRSDALASIHTMRKPFQLMLVCAVILCAFYPTLFAEISLVDDIKTIQWMLNVKFDLRAIGEILLPRSSHGGYYRPVVILSFLLDQYLWNGSAALMHFEGVLSHLINVLLVYLITAACLRLRTQEDSFPLPLVAALLFGLHPIVTESVNWISGRTDTMMSNFVLLSALMLLKYKDCKQMRYLMVAIGSALLGCITKETAFAFLVGAVCLYFANPNAVKRSGGEGPVFRDVVTFLAIFSVMALSALFFGNYWMTIAGVCAYAALVAFQGGRFEAGRRENIRIALVLITVAVTSLALFLVMRRIAYSSDLGKIGQTVKLILGDKNYAISVFTGAAGFYVKKFLMPVPLSFFILEIDPVYDFAGMVVLLVSVRLALLGTLPAAFWTAGMGMFVPALPFAFGTIAWTGYAERYIYLSTAFWVIALVLYAAEHLAAGTAASHSSRNITVWLAALLLSAMLVVTFHRNQVWQRNTTLIGDTVSKAPRIKVLRNIYMAALIQDENIAEAKRQYAVASSLFSLTDPDKADLMMGELLLREKKYNEAFQLYSSALHKLKYQSVDLLNAMLDLLYLFDRLPEAPLDDITVQRSIEFYRLKLIESDKTAETYFRMGQKSLAAGKRHEAGVYFSSALRDMQPGHPLHKSTRIMIDSLKRE